MTEFCVDTVIPESGLRPEYGVLRGDGLLATSDARTVADRLLQQAQIEKQTLLREAETEARLAVQSAQEKVAREASQLLGALETAHATLLDRAQGLIVDLALRLFERLVMEVTPREKIEAVLRRLQLEAPSKLVTPMLWVHPDDLGVIPETAWEVKTDPSLARGACKLEAASGEWRAEFGAAAEALKSAFAQAVEMSRSTEQELPPAP